MQASGDEQGPGERRPRLGHHAPSGSRLTLLAAVDGLATIARLACGWRSSRKLQNADERVGRHDVGRHPLRNPRQWSPPKTLDLVQSPTVVSPRRPPDANLLRAQSSHSKHRRAHVLIERLLDRGRSPFWMPLTSSPRPSPQLYAKQALALLLASPCRVDARRLPTSAKPRPTVAGQQLHRELDPPTPSRAVRSSRQRPSTVSRTTLPSTLQWLVRSPLAGLALQPGA